MLFFFNCKLYLYLMKKNVKKIVGWVANNKSLLSFRNRILHQVAYFLYYYLLLVGDYLASKPSLAFCWETRRS